MSRSWWETAAIVDVTGCCPVSSNAVAVQGILASGTDSSGPGMGCSGLLWRGIFRKVSGALGVVVSRRRWRASSTTVMRHRYNGPNAALWAVFAPYRVVRSVGRVLRLLNHRRAAPGGGPARPPYRSPSLRLSTTHHLQPRHRGYETALARLLNHRHALPGRRPKPRALPSPVAALSTDGHPQPRAGLDTLSLAPAARPDGKSSEVSRRRWRASSTTGAGGGLDAVMANNCCWSRSLTSWCDPRGPAAGARRRGSRRRDPRTSGARHARTGRGRRCAVRKRCRVPPGR